MTASWRFREMSRGEINVDPVHDEFFKAQDLADALVRESIQNSLDARRGRSTVRVRFRFATGPSALDRDAASRWLVDLLPHLDALDPSLQNTFPGADEPLSYLVVEDFGTRGLAGDPAANPDVDDDAAEGNDFHFFWRNVGRGTKGDLDRGRWGLGKVVFSVASSIRTFFGITRRSEDERVLLMGQAMLKIHSVDGKRFAPYGFFARFDRDHFAMPIEDERHLERFASDFQIVRDEPGLSIVVPFPRVEDFPFERVITSVIEQYFYPIARGDLQVEVIDDGRSETISSRTLDEIASRYAADRLAGDAKARLCDLARWAAILPPDEIVRLRDPGGSAPKWNEGVVPPEVLEILRARFNRGERIALEVPLPVKRKGGKPASTSFRVILEKDETLSRRDHHFIRRGITISGIPTPPRDKSVRGLVVIDEPPLARLLGDAENPAHSDWSERADKVKLLYDHGPFTVRYVRSSLPFLITLLAKPPEGAFRDLLADVFAIEIDGAAEAPAAARRPASVGETRDAAGPYPAARAASATPLRIVPLLNGFALRRGQGDDRAAFRAEVAYRVVSGNPFTRWDRRDFILGEEPIAIGSKGTAVRRIDGNTMEIEMAIADAELTVTGFDRHRDLVVRVTPLSDDAEETELH